MSRRSSIRDRRPLSGCAPDQRPKPTARILRAVGREIVALTLSRDRALLDRPADHLTQPTSATGSALLAP